MIQHAIRAHLRSAWKVIEPWYNWGTINIERFDTVGQDGRDGIEGDARFFDLQWFGLHISIQIGRLPPKEGC